MAGKKFLSSQRGQKTRERERERRERERETESGREQRARRCGIEFHFRALEEVVNRFRQTAKQFFFFFFLAAHTL